MDIRSFANMIRSLRCLEHHDLPFMSDAQFLHFESNPPDFFIRCDDETQERLFAAIKARQPKREAV